MDYIDEYIKEWNDAPNPKPQNNAEFIKEFTKFAKDSDFDRWEFDGENGYCGYTAVLHEHPPYLPVYGLGFEFAYGRDFVKVFTNRHNGFWTPEYINLKGEDSKELISIIKDKLIGWAGF
jgi:hypothetical protein